MEARNLSIHEISLRNSLKIRIQQPRIDDFHTFDSFSPFRYRESTAEYEKSALLERNGSLEKDLTFQKLANQFEPLIWHVIRSFRIYKDFDLYYQAGLIGLWKAWRQFAPDKGEFSAFAYHKVKGQILNEFEKEVRFQHRHMLTEHDDRGNNQLYEENPFEREILLSYCHELTDNQKKWVLQTFLEGKKLQEIAESEGVTYEAVKSWRRGAMKQLRKKWKDVKCE
jgi:RNA polymerase sigma factor (sigma-70 family)